MGSSLSSVGTNFRIFSAQAFDDLHQQPPSCNIVTQSWTELNLCFQKHLSSPLSRSSSIGISLDATSDTKGNMETQTKLEARSFLEFFLGYFKAG